MVNAKYNQTEVSDKKNSLCEECPLHKKGKWIKGEGPKEAKIMIIGGRPTIQDIRRKRHYSGKYRPILFKFLEYAGIDPDDVYITYLTKCVPKGKNIPRQAIKTCSEILDKQIRGVKPNVILALGSEVTNFLKGSRYKVTDHILEVEYLKEYDCKAVYSYNIGTAYRMRTRDEIFKKTFELLRDNMNSTKLNPRHKVDYKTIQNLDELKELQNTLDKVDIFSADLETAGFNFHDDAIICGGVAWEKGVARCVTFLDDANKPFFGKDQKDALQIWKEIMESDINKVFQNYKFDKKFFLGNNIYPNNITYDTMLAHYLIDENLPHDLSFLSRMYTDMNAYDLPLLKYKKNNRVKNYGEIPRDLLAEYVCGDADCTYRLFKKFEIIINSDDSIDFHTIARNIKYASTPEEKAEYKQELKKQLQKAEKMKSKSGLRHVLLDILIPLQEVLADIEFRGVLIDKTALNTLYKEKEELLVTLEKKMNEIAGYEINPRSPKQLRKLLFDTLNLPVLEKTATGMPSTGKDVLKQLQDEHEFVDVLMQSRIEGKLFSTYIKGLKKLVEDRDTVHTSYLIHGTKTGRLASRNPNLQNIPKDPTIQRIFKARDGYKFVEADFSQAELRVLAQESGDKNLIEAFTSGKDIHKVVASRSLKVPYDDITKEQRRIAKGISFGLVYGRQSNSLAEELEISKTEAKEFITRFFDEYPQVKTWVAKKHREAKSNGFVRNLFGRKRRLPDAQLFKVLRQVFGISPRNKDDLQYLEGEALRQAQNSPIQSTSSDLTCLSMIKLYNRIREEGRDVRILMNIHDAICFEVPEKTLEEDLKMIKEEMENPIPNHFNEELLVPAVVDVEVGDNWGEMELVEVEL